MTTNTNTSANTMLDSPRDVREGEELDEAGLSAWLTAQLGPSDAPLDLAQFPAGHSNLTYRIIWAGADYVLRRPPFGSAVKSAHDMAREYRILSRLAGPSAADWAPHPVAFCDDHAVLGCDFYLMRRLQGVILRKRLPKGLTLNPPMARRLSELLTDTLVSLHATDLETTGLSAIGHPEGYVRRQVEGWTRRYAASKTDEISAVDALATWLAAHMPADTGPCLIHNDFKFDNLVLAPDDLTHVIGVLDWEMATVGDPLMDLGTTLAYWIEATDPAPMQMLAFGPTHRPGMFTRQELATRYAEATERSIDNIVFYYAFGLFKTAVVAQQIYYRFAKGLTTDRRFAMFIEAVKMLAAQALGAIERGRISV